jgi:hypothetical protein
MTICGVGKRVSGCWLFGAFLITELRAISKDRAETQHQALLDRQAQDAAFSDVRQTQDANFSATASGLTTAIAGIKSTLTAADTTLMQTRPHAAIRFDRIEFSPVPSEVKPDTLYKFNIHYVNGGSISAIKLESLAQEYIGEEDNKDAQVRLALEFEKAWKNIPHATEGVLVPDYPSFGTVDRTFTDEEMKDFGTSVKTIYYLIRYEYSDDTGRWRTDICGSFQKERKQTETNLFQLDTNIFHTCSVFQRFRYPVRRLETTHPK